VVRVASGRYPEFLPRFGLFPVAAHQKVRLELLPRVQHHSGPIVRSLARFQTDQLPLNYFALGLLFDPLEKGGLEMGTFDGGTHRDRGLVKFFLLLLVENVAIEELLLHLDDVGPLPRVRGEAEVGGT